MAAAACTADPVELFVDVRTALTPGTDFDQVLTELLEDEARPPVRSTRTSVSAVDDFASGHRVAELSEVAQGAYVIRVTALLGDAPVVSRRLFVQLDSARAVTVDLDETTPTPDGGVDAAPDGAPDGSPDAAGALRLEPVAAMNVNSHTTLRASGGVPPYAFSIVSDGGRVNPDTGDLTTMNYGGEMTVRVTDTEATTADQTITVGGTSLFAIGGWGGETNDHVSQTVDGSAWTRNALPAPRGEIVTIVFDDAIYVVGGWMSGMGNVDSVLRSESGLTGSWSVSGYLPSPRGWGSAVVFEDRIIYAGGRSPSATQNNDVFASPDGNTWTKIGELPEASTWGGLAVFRGELFYLGGNRSGGPSDEIFSSPDGATWSTETGHLPLALAGGAIVVFDDQLWYLGGEKGEGGLNDHILRSDNGVDWSDTGAFVPSPFENAAVAVHEGEIWLVGGNDGGYRPDTYHSPDGLTWTRAADLPVSVDRLGAVSFTARTP